jgi:UDP-N-acetylglucosamine 1-carboxyvinyltransferase
MASSSIMNRFCENLERIRQERGLTQSDLADLLGTKQSAVSRLLNGGEDVTLSRCERIAEMLQIDVKELIFGESPKKSKNHRSVMLT